MKKTSFILGLALSIVFLTTIANSAINHPGNSQASKFLILVETTELGIILTCEEGCAWKDLSFTLKPFQVQGIDQYGMSSESEQKKTVDDNLADFHFSIKKTNDGINLEKTEGTSWRNLSFSCPKTGCHQYIDQNGMTSKE